MHIYTYIHISNTYMCIYTIYASLHSYSTFHDMFIIPDIDIGFWLDSRMKSGRP